MNSDDAAIDAITNLPISAKAGLQYDISKNEVIFDCKIFPPCYNKVEPLGTLKKRKMLIECDGLGRFNIKELVNFKEQLEMLAELKEKGIITQEEFERKKKDILERI